MTDEAPAEPEEATDAEVARYEEAYRETRRALDESIELLALLKTDEKDLDIRSELGERLLELKRERADLVRANLAFHSGRAVMTPPSPQLTQEIIDNTKEVVELTVERATASAVLKLATTALTKFAEIQDISDV